MWAARIFKELKNLVLEQSASGPAVKLAGALQEGESFSLSAWMNRQQLYLQKTAEQLDPAEFERAVQALIQARQVYIHGKNASGSLAQLLFFRLRRLGIAVSLLPSSGSELLEGLHLAHQGDLVILFSLSKLSREGRVILDYAKTAGYTTLSFVSRTCLPPEESAQINLFSYRGTEKEYHSMAAPSMVLDALVVALASRIGRQGAQSLESLQRLKKEYGGSLG